MRTLLLPVVPLALAFSVSGFARKESWTDRQGNQFAGEPMEIALPYALFRTDQGVRTVPVTLLTPEDCARCFEQTRDNKPAEKWANAKGRLTSEVSGRLLVPAGKEKWEESALKDRPEPEFLIVVYADQNEQRQRDMVEAAKPAYENFKKRYGGRTEAIFYGIRQTRMDELGMARYTGMPWCLIDPEERSKLFTLNRFRPVEGFGIVVFTRDGEPMFVELAPHEPEVKRLFEKLNGMLDTMRPDNPKSWGAFAYFWGSVQMKEHANDHADPMLVGDPIVPEGLKQRNVTHFDAKLHVDAAGKITDVAFSPDDAPPEKFTKPLADALKKAVIVPAVDHGKFVDGVYDYRFRTE